MSDILYPTSSIPAVDNEYIKINEDGKLSSTEKINDNLLPERNIPDDEGKYARVDENGNVVWKDVDIKKVNQLEDVELDENLNTGDALTYDKENEKWVNKPLPSKFSLMDDVEIDDPKQDDILRYSNSLQKWINVEDNGNRFSIVVKSGDAALQNNVNITIKSMSDGTTYTAPMVNGSVEFGVRHGGKWEISEPVGGNYFYTEDLKMFGEYFYNITSYKIFGYHVSDIDIGLGVEGRGVSYKIEYIGIDPETGNEYSMKVSNYDYDPAYMDYNLDEWNWGSWNKNEFFIPRPCLLSQDCTHIIYLDPDNLGYTEDGHDTVEIGGKENRIIDLLKGYPARDIEGNELKSYNAMMQWGRKDANGVNKQIWYKVLPDSDSLDYSSYSVYFSNFQVDKDFHAYSFYNCDDELIPYFYTAIYDSSYTGTYGDATTTLRSVSHANVKNTAASNLPIIMVNKNMYLLTNCAKRNNMNEKVEWYIGVYADRMLINLLTTLITRSLNSQLVIGNGADYAGTNVSVDIIPETGTGNKKGLFYGKIKTTDNKDENKTVAKVFGTENYYSCLSKMYAGLYIKAAQYYIKMTYGKADGSTEIGYYESSVANPATTILTGYICGTNLNPDLKQRTAAVTKWCDKVLADKFGVVLPMTTNTALGSNIKYYCDSARFAATNNQNNYYVRCGRLCNANNSIGQAGLYCNDFNNIVTTASNDSSAQLSCKPISVPSKIN